MFDQIDYFLRGVEALKIDIDNLKSLTDRQLLFNNKEALSILNNAKYENWIKYDFDLALKSRNKNPYLILLTFILFGNFFHINLSKNSGAEPIPIKPLI